MKIIVNEETPQQYTLERAILLYRTIENNASIAIEHQIHENGGTPRLGAGRFVTESFVKRLLEMFDSSPLAYIPEHVVAVNRDAIAWFVPASKRRMYFRADRDIAVNAFDAHEVAQPPLVFVARRRMLRVFALTSDTRPTLGTALAYAPYFNVNETGDVCLGSMHVPKSVNPNDTETWTQAFFASEFTHHNGTSKRWAHPGTYAELLADLSCEGTFRPEWLRKTNLILKDVIASV